jgi:hypothetical protein
MCYKNQGKDRQFTAGAVLFIEVAGGAIINSKKRLCSEAGTSEDIRQEPEGARVGVRAAVYV